MQARLHFAPCSVAAAHSRRQSIRFGSPSSTSNSQCCLHQSLRQLQHGAQHAQQARRCSCIPSAMNTSGQGPEDMYSDISEQIDREGDYEGPQLVPMDVESQGGLGGTSEDVFGELREHAVFHILTGEADLQAVLLIGFSQQEFATFRQIMNDMEADFVPVVPCSLAMLDGTLGAAVTSPPPRHQQLPAGTRRAVLMSGMSTAEVMEVIGAYSDTESLPETLYGAAVPNNYGRNLRALLAEMYDDKDWKSKQDMLEGAYQNS